MSWIESVTFDGDTDMRVHSYMATGALALIPVFAWAAPTSAPSSAQSVEVTTQHHAQRHLDTLRHAAFADSFRVPQRRTVLFAEPLWADPDAVVVVGPTPHAL